MLKNNTLPLGRTILFYPILVISLCALFQFYKYVLQIYPSIITTELMSEFHLTAASLGNLAATFYYTSMVMQLFVGMILDKYSVRLVTSIAIFNCALGAFLFSQAHTLFAAEFARALMGLGVAFATVSYMKLVAIWFPPRQYAFVSGLLATAAMSGAVFGEAPLAWYMNKIGWRDCLCWIGLAGFALAFLFSLIVQDVEHPHHRTTHKSFKDFLKEIVLILRNKNNWLLTFYGGFAFSPVAVFGGLWGNPFLQQAYHLTKTQAASFVSLTFIGLGIGSPILGFLSSRITNKRLMMFYSTLVACIVLSLVLYGHSLPLLFLGTLLFIFGFALGAFMLVFTIGKEINPLHLTATIIAMINASDAILDSVTEPVIGKLLDLMWDGKMLNGVRYFSLHDYRLALSILPLYLLIAACLVFLIVDQSPRTI